MSKNIWCAVCSYMCTSFSHQHISIIHYVCVLTLCIGQSFFTWQNLEIF